MVGKEEVKRCKKISRIHCFSIAKCIVIITIFWLFAIFIQLTFNARKISFDFLSFSLLLFIVYAVSCCSLCIIYCSRGESVAQKMAASRPSLLQHQCCILYEWANGNELRNKNVFLTLQRHLWLEFGHEEKYLSSINKLNDFQFSSHSLCRLSHHFLRLHSYLKILKHTLKIYVWNFLQKINLFCTLSLDIILNEFQNLFMIDSDEMILLVNLSGNFSNLVFFLFLKIMIKFFHVKIDKLSRYFQLYIHF